MITSRTKLTQSPWFLNTPYCCQPPLLRWPVLVGSEVDSYLGCPAAAGAEIVSFVGGSAA
jgi:hypothetical protein